MGKIKKILENELTGGNQSTEIYPVTSIKAVYDENNERLDNIIDRKDNEIQKELEAEVARATNAESNLRETINNITEVNENATSANIVTIDTIPNTSSSNVQQALNELYKWSEIGSGGNIILEWNTDAATTRKQVKQSDRKSLLQISYKDADGNIVNEQYIGTSFTDTNWANDNNWLKIANDEDIEAINCVPSSTDYADSVSDAFNGILKPASRQNNLLYYLSKYKNISFIQITGTAGSDGTLIINYDSQEYRISISQGDDDKTIAAKVTNISNATISTFDNLIKLECKEGGKNPGTTASFESTISGLKVKVSNQTTTGTIPYLCVIAHKINTYDNGTNKANYFKSFKELSIDKIDSSFLTVDVRIDSLSISEDNTVSWYCNGISSTISENYITTGSGFTWVVKPGYAFGYRYFKSTSAVVGFIADIISVSDLAENKYSFMPLIINSPKGYYYGKVIDEFKELCKKYKPKAYCITSGYIPYEKNLEDGSIKITNNDTGTFSRVIRVISDKSDMLKEKFNRLSWTEFTIPKNSLLILDYLKMEMYIKESLDTHVCQYKTDTYEVVLLANNLGNLAGGDWMPYINAYDQYLATYAIKNTKQIGYDSIATTGRGYHDCTFIGDYFWSFDKYDDGGNFYLLNANDFSSYKRGTTNFVDNTGFKIELKSVDYNSVNNILAIGNGSSRSVTGNSHIYLFYEFQEWPNKGEIITFDNCGKYVDIDVSDLGVKSYGFWAGVEDMMYISINRFEDIYLIQLGKGSNNLGSGTYNYVDDDTFNGTYKVINRWNQDSYLGYAAHGGQYYDGNLYLADNHGGLCQIFKCLLNEDGSLQFENINLWKYTTDGTKLQNTDIDGLAIKDGYFYAQPLNNNSGQGTKIIIKAPIPR